MDLKRWVDAKFKVQFHATYELPRKVTEAGFITRAYGVSMGAAVLLDMDRPQGEDFLDNIRNLAETGEKAAVETLETLFNDEDTHAQLLAEIPEGKLTIANYFPGVTIEIRRDDGEEVSVDVVINERVVSPGNRERFIAIMSAEEAEIYQLERSPS